MGLNYVLHIVFGAAVYAIIIRIIAKNEADTDFRKILLVMGIALIASEGIYFALGSTIGILALVPILVVHTLSAWRFLYVPFGKAVGAVCIYFGVRIGLSFLF